MEGMFNNARHFNQPIGNWNVSQVTDMNRMFSGASKFNQSIGQWNVSNVTDMSGMFFYAVSFNKDISGWDVSNGTDFSDMFSGATLMIQNKGVSATPYQPYSPTFENKTDLSNAIDAWIDDQDAAIELYGDINTWDVSEISDFSMAFSKLLIFAACLVVLCSCLHSGCRYLSMDAGCLSGRSCGILLGEPS